jgi:hypothetical protein
VHGEETKSGKEIFPYPMVSLEVEKVLAEEAKERQRQQALINSPFTSNREIIPDLSKGKADREIFPERSNGCNCNR